MFGSTPFSRAWFFWIGVMALWPAPLMAEDKIKVPGGFFVEKNNEAGGIHWRMMTPNGIVHVWRPERVAWASLGTVVYLHGYYADVDKAWQSHRLAEQFAASNRNAVFIVPQAPTSDDELVYWEKLEDLVGTVTRQLRLTTLHGHMLVIAHSGAFRTLLYWLNHPPLAEIILIDGLYRNENDFLVWLAKSPQRRLVLVAADTFDRCEQLAKRLPFAVSRSGIPDQVERFSPRERWTRLLYVRGQYEHMELVTSGRVVPLFLQLSRLPPVPPPQPTPKSKAKANPARPAAGDASVDKTT